MEDELDCIAKPFVFFANLYKDEPLLPRAIAETRSLDRVVDAILVVRGQGIVSSKYSYNGQASLAKAIPSLVSVRNVCSVISETI